MWWSNLTHTDLCSVEMKPENRGFKQEGKQVLFRDHENNQKWNQSCTWQTRVEVHSECYVGFNLLICDLILWKCKGLPIISS